LLRLSSDIFYIAASENFPRGGHIDEEESLQKEKRVDLEEAIRESASSKKKVMGGGEKSRSGLF
jgi:hypothetical protein